MVEELERLVLEGELEEALEEASDILEEYPNAHRIRLFKAKTSLREEESRMELDKLLDKLPKGDLKEDALWEYARLDYLCGQFASAVKLLRTLLAEYPDSERTREILLLLGQSLLLDGQNSDAAGMFYRVILKYPDSPEAHLATLGVGHVYINRNQLEPAETQFRMIADDQDSVYREEAYYKLAELYKNAGDLRKAVRMYQTITDKFPGSPQAQQAKMVLNQLPEASQLKKSTEPTPTTEEESFQEKEEPEFAPERIQGTVYMVQVGAFARIKYAERMKEDMEAKGYPAKVYTNASGAKTIHRVRLGPYETREEAAQTVNRLDEKENIFSYIVKTELD